MEWPQGGFLLRTLLDGMSGASSGAWVSPAEWRYKKLSIEENKKGLA